MIKTKYGNASLDSRGHYRIVNRKGGNYGKKLHRVIFEDFYQTKLPDNWVVHHDDFNKLNNNIWNLVPMNRSEHMRIHQKGKIIDKATRTKMSKIASSNKTKTGFYRVQHRKDKHCKRGFNWTYQYRDENGKRQSIYSVNLLRLMEKVLMKHLEWEIIDMKKAIETAKTDNIPIEYLKGGSV